MTSKKTTRRALFSSVIALILCCSMLVGTTFAWFTDSVSSVNNVITAGNLDVELYHKVGDNYVEVGDTNLFASDLWEPGHVQVVHLKVANVGTLALKYQLQVGVAAETGSVNKDGKDFKLSEHIQFAIIDGEFNGTREEAVAEAEKNAVKVSELNWTVPGEMEPATAVDYEDEYVTLVVWMPESVGNEANYDRNYAAPTVTLGINLLATQVEYEEDSFGDDYDEGLDPSINYVGSQKALEEALQKGGKVVLLSDVEIDPATLNTTAASIPVALAVTGGEPVVLDLNGFDITLPETGDNTTAVIYVHDTDLTITGEGTISQQGTNDYLLWAKGDSEVTILGGDFVTAPDDCSVLYASGNVAYSATDPWATINVYGGNFTSGNTKESQDCVNVMNHGVGRVNYYGGTYNWNPTGEGMNWDYNWTDDKNYVAVAEGYVSVDNGDGTWTVLPAVEGETLSKDPASGLYYNGKATWGTYYVYNASDLEKAADHFAGTAHTSEANICNIELMADIDLSGKVWDSWSVMWINFDGNGHTISNVTTAEGWRAGFFGYAGAVKIDNLTLENVNSTGAQAGTFAGSAEGLKVNNCFLKGDNTVTYAEYVSPEYTETWGGVGAVTGVLTSSTVNVEIIAGATVNVNKGDMTTNCAYVDALTGYLGTNSGTVTNNGAVNVSQTVSTAADLIDAVKNGSDVVLSGTADLGGTKGNYLTLTDDTTITGGTIKGTGWTGELNYAVNATDGNIVFDGVTFDTTDWSTEGWAQWGISVNVNGTANVTFKNCTFKGTQCPIYQSGANSVVTLENCTFDTTSVAIQCEIYSGDFTLGQDLIVKNCDFTGVADVLHIYDYDKDPSSEAIAQYLTDNGNIFTGVCKQTCNK